MEPVIKGIMTTETWHDSPNGCLELLEGSQVSLEPCADPTDPRVAWRVVDAPGLHGRDDVFLRDTDVELVK